VNILLAAHSPALSPLPIGSVHLAGAWARAGHRVVHLDPPLSPLHLVRVRDPQLWARLRRRRRHESPEGWAAAGQWALTPVPVLERLPRLADVHLSARLPRLLPRLDELGARPVDLLVVDTPYAAGMRDLVAPGRTVYRATDVYHELLDRPRLVEVERRVAAEADALVATSGPVAEHLAGLSGGRPVTVVPNGAAHSQLEPSRSDPPRAVYAGALDDRFDAAALARLVEANPGVEFHVVGGGPKLGDVPSAANVVRHGWLGHGALLDLLVTATVGLVPLLPSPANEGRSPIKVFEYLAAGLTVVATSTAELRRLGLDRVRLATGTDELVDLFREALAGPPLAGAALEQLRRELSWDGRADQVLAAAGIDAAGSRVAAGGGTR
jgi:teichuronic acid biosynthesis glycosyltransferase TuaH